MELGSVPLFDKYCIKCGVEIKRTSRLEKRSLALKLTKLEREELHKDFISMQKTERERWEELKIGNITPEAIGGGKLL